MGVVYKAQDRLLEETVALKVLRGEIASPELARRFRDEIRLARRVSHRNVCRIHEYGEDGSLHFISMAFVDGVDLKRLLQSQGPLPPLEALETARAVAAGLQAIHDENIVHRDLKTANIMRDRKGVVRLMDFGIAKDWSAGASSGHTATGIIVGSPEYMSPEQATGARIDARSDVYALGIVVYELFTASVPFRADTPMATLLRHIQEPLRLDTAEASRIPEPVRPILARALAKSPADRFGSAREMGEALDQVQRLAFPAGAVTATGSTPDAERVTLVPPPTPVPAVTRVPEHTARVTATAVSPPPRPRSVWPWVLIVPAGLLVLVAGLGLVGWLILSGWHPSAPSPSISATAATGPSPPFPTPSNAPATPAPEPAVATTPAATAPPKPRPAAGSQVEARPAGASEPVAPPRGAAPPEEAAATAPGPGVAAAETAWADLGRVVDDSARPETERAAALRKFIAEDSANPHRPEAERMLARLQEEVRRRLLAPPDPASLGRVRPATYVGGTLHDLAENSEGSVAFPDKERMVFLIGGGRFLVVPYKGISGVEYGLTDHIRGLVFKKKSHYVSLSYQDPAGETQGMVLELGKDDFRPVLTTLEARSGHKVQYQDEKAAKERWR